MDLLCDLLHSRSTLDDHRLRRPRDLHHIPRRLGPLQEDRPRLRLGRAQLSRQYLLHHEVLAAPLLHECVRNSRPMQTINNTMNVGTSAQRVLCPAESPP